MDNKFLVINGGSSSLKFSLDIILIKKKWLMDTYKR